MEASEAEEPVAPTDFFGDEEEEAVPSSFDLALEKSLPIFFGIFAAVLFCCGGGGGGDCGDQIIVKGDLDR